MKALRFCAQFMVTVLVGGAALAATAVLLVPAARSLSHATTPLGDLNVTINAPSARSFVYDRYGNVMGTLSDEDRQPVKLSQIPQVLIDAVISTEDRKFYEHHGVDWGGTARALFKNVDAGGIAQGGSTITQQLVKNTLSLNRKRDLKTKAREAILAIRLEHELTKNQILADYLNLVYFGNGAYGVEVAAERYFPTTGLAHLDLAQAALLAGLIQAPEALNPIRFPAAAARRRAEVLDSMVENSKITVAQARVAKGVPLPTTVSYPNARPLDYYVAEVKDRLFNDDPNVIGDPGEVLGSTQQVRAAAVLRGGLRIYTSYDPNLQYLANLAMAAQLPPSKYTASLVVINNFDGGVAAIANGRPYSQVQFDPATEGNGRQAGSSFKMFTLAAALSRGYNPNDQVSGAPITTRISAGHQSQDFYTVHTDCGASSESLSSAIARSDNCAFVRTELSLGPGNYGADGARVVAQMAHTMGIDTSKFVPAVTTTLGTNGVHPLEMAQAYSVLANEGVLKRATFITKIVDRNGKTIYQAPNVGVRVLDANVARTETQMLFGPVRNGTASGTLGNFPRPIAGKTGTTDSSQDAWFIGYTPQYTASVWMGDQYGETPIIINGRQVFGADYPARIWRAFMLAATANLPKTPFNPPDLRLLPRASFITEFGRKVGAGLFPGFLPQVTTPVITTPSPTTVAQSTTTVPTHRRSTTTLPPPTTTPTTVVVPPTTTAQGP